MNPFAKIAAVALVALDQYAIATAGGQASEQCDNEPRFTLPVDLSSR